MSYAEFITKPISEKSVFAWIEPTQRLISWTLHSGSVYRKSVDFPVITLTEDGTDATEVSSIGAIDADNKWYYDHENKTIYYRATGEVDPTSLYVVSTYRISFSDRPSILPYSDSGGDVEYLPFINRDPKLDSGLDKDQLGISVESRSKVNMLNDGEFWVSYYDKLTWSNKRILLYSWSPEITFSQKQVIFDGLVEDINYTNTSVSITIKDFLNVLRERIPLNIYSSSDGEIADSVIGKPKRRVYGRVSGLLTQSVNQILDGFTLTGTVSGSASSRNVTGSGTDFTNEVSPEDTITISSVEYKVETVSTATSLTVSETIETAFSSATATLLPEIPSIRTGRNTDYFIADHTIREATTTVTSAPQLNRIVVADTTDFEAGDNITVGGTSRQILRISGSTIVLTQNLASTPANGTSVVRNPVQAAFVLGKELVINRDFTITNSSSGSKLILDPLAEFNITPQTKFSGSATFTNTSTTVTFSGINAKDELKPRDWIKPDEVTGYPNWYEVLSVDSETQVTIRTQFAEVTTTDDLLVKKIDPIGDNAKLTVDTLGKTKDGIKTGELVRTAADIVEDLLKEAGLTARLASASFTESSAQVNSLMSLPIPIEPLQNSPNLRDIINEINNSVFGSLYTNSDQQIAYSILTADKSTTLLDEQITDDEIISWDIKSSSKDIIKRVTANYRHQDSDRFNGERAASVYQFDNTNVERLVGTSREAILDVRMYELNDVTSIAQRKALFNETSRSTISIRGKIDLVLKQVNDSVILNLERLYNRFGALSDNRKIALVLKISKSGSNVNLDVDDISNIFNKSANIAPNGSADFSSASDDDKIMHGFIADTDDLIEDDETTFRTNLIT